MSRLPRKLKKKLKKEIKPEELAETLNAVWRQMALASTAMQTYCINLQCVSNALSTKALVIKEKGLN